jgi:hypothetical protein
MYFTDHGSWYSRVVLRSLQLAALTFLSACTEPTAPDSISAVSEARLQAPASPTPSASEAVDFSDVFGRILPSFADQGLAEELKAQILSLEAAFTADDRTAAAAALTRTRNLIGRSDAHPANVGAIRLALRRVEELVDVGETEQSGFAADDSNRSP